MPIFESVTLYIRKAEPGGKRHYERIVEALFGAGPLLARNAGLPHG